MQGGETSIFSKFFHVVYTTLYVIVCVIVHKSKTCFYSRMSIHGEVWGWGMVFTSLLLCCVSLDFIVFGTILKRCWCGHYMYYLSLSSLPSPFPLLPFFLSLLLPPSHYADTYSKLREHWHFSKVWPLVSLALSLPGRYITAAECQILDNSVFVNDHCVLLAPFLCFVGLNALPCTLQGPVLYGIFTGKAGL